MRKEVTIIIFVGVILGILVAFGIWRANSAFKTINTPATINKQAQSNSSEETSPQTQLTVAKPEQNDVSTENKTTITGVTIPNSWVVISAEDEDYTTQADDRGAFEQEIALVGGLNQLIIYSFVPDGGSASRKLDLVYSSEFSKEIIEN